MIVLAHARRLRLHQPDSRPTPRPLRWSTRRSSCVLWVSILVALFVIACSSASMPSPCSSSPHWLRQMYRADLIYGSATRTTRTAPTTSTTTRAASALPSSLAARIDRIVDRARAAAIGAAPHDRLDPERQPFIRTLLSITWVQWFVAFVVAWVLFAALFWIIPGARRQPRAHARRRLPAWRGHSASGRGSTTGSQQQDVARGGQPWYYYLLLIPLYEQLAVRLRPRGHRSTRSSARRASASSWSGGSSPRSRSTPGPARRCRGSPFTSCCR